MSLLLLLLSAVARAEDPSRDDDIFGAPSSSPPAPDAPTTPAPTTPASSDGGISAPGQDFTAMDNQQIDTLLGDADKTLTYGGKLYLRYTNSVTEDQDWADSALRSPDLLDLFVDARPNDRVRAYTQARLNYNPSIPSTDPNDATISLEDQQRSVKLDQLWIKTDIDHKVYLTMGRQRIKWGAGRFWNPTDFLNNQTRDPLAIFDERLGVDLVRAHIPFEKTQTNLYLIAAPMYAYEVQQVSGSARIEQVLGTSEVSLSVMAGKDQPLHLGGDVSAALGPVDLHIEAAVQKGLELPFYKGELDFDTLTFPTEYTREDEWLPQVVAGLEVPIRLNDEDSLTLGAEYFYNETGYDDRADLYPWLLLNSRYTSFYLGQQYAAVYAFLAGPGQWDDTSFTASGLSNLSDKSYVARFDVQQKANTYLSLSASASMFFGENGEFYYSYGDLLDSPVVQAAGVTLPFGVSAEPTHWQFTLGAMVDF